MTSNALSVFASAAASPVVEEEKSNKRVLTVGPETCLKGEISRCDRVVIEGQVHAEMKEVDSLEIASGGAFVGSAVVGNAEISGHFEGDLKVEGRLVVHEQGSVHGKLVYGEIQVMRGGKIVGQVSLAGDASDEQPEASATKETKKERASKLANA